LADVNTGGAGTLRLDVSQASTNPGANNVNINWALYLIERVTSNSTFQNSAIGANVSIDGVGTIWSGSFTFDWRGAGNQTTLIASGTATLGNNGDGTGRTWTFRGHMNSTGTSGAGGPTDVAQAVGTSATYVTPGTPTKPVASRVSDTQTNLAWTQSSASNGQPASNQVYCKTNNGGSVKILDISATNSAAIGTVANSKYEFQVQAWNSAGFSGVSPWSDPIFTTPGAPTSATATKQANLDIVVAWVNNVAYAEYNTEVWHGTVSGGVTTWDSTALTTVGSGVTSYTHAAPNPSQVHVYQVRSKAGTLLSSYAVSNSVQLLVAPNKPTLGTVPQYADKTQALTFGWTHNPIDTTPQSAYEVNFSTNGGSTWTTTGKVTSAVASRTIAANTYVANTAVQIRVRTWGQATTGGSDGTGASPWSDISTVTYKTAPTTTITIPANGGTVTDSTLRVTITFAQAEAATFVKATLELWQGAVLLESKDTTVLNGVVMSTPVQNGVTYTIKSKVLDSNGLWSSQVSNSFSVVYLAPVPAGIVLTYLPDTGWGQLDLSIPAPGGGQSAAATVTITRTINGLVETVVQDYPVSGTAMTFLDTVPTVNGVNLYTVTTKSALGATTQRTASLTTSELRRAFLSKGASFQTVGVFGANLSVDESLDVASTTIEAAGRTKPIGMYGTETSLQLKISSFVYENFGSTIDQLRKVLLTPGEACYRDASGRRVFGTAKGSLTYKRVDRADLSFTMTETS